VEQQLEEREGEAILKKMKHNITRKKKVMVSH
jgi:hypothetical protein